MKRHLVHRSSAGYTILEALVATSILGVVLATTASLVSGTTRVFTRETTLVTVGGGLASAKSILLDDLSIAGFLKTPSTTFIAVTTQTTSDAVTFEGDIDSNGTPDRICYLVSSGNLLRKIVAGGTACDSSGYETVAANVSAFTLTFLDANRAVIPAANVAQITGGGARWVDVLLTISAPAGHGNAVRSIYGEVALRN